MEEARSSVSRHIWKSAKLAHSKLKPPFSRSQLKLPLLLEVARDSALSGEFTRELPVLSDSDSDSSASARLACELPVPRSSDSSVVLPRELPRELQLRSD